MMQPTGGTRHTATLVVSAGGIDELAHGEGVRLIGRLRESGQTVMAIDVLGVGEHGPTPAEGEGFVTTYNRTLLAERVQDVLTALVWLRSRPGIHQVNLVGEGAMGPVCLLARAMDAGVARTAIDADGFEYELERDEPAKMRLPGMLRFGGLRAAAALATPGPLLLHHTGGALDPAWARRAYELEGHPAALRTSEGRLGAEEVAAWLCEGDGHG
jgi:hypothetical protein